MVKVKNKYLPIVLLFLLILIVAFICFLWSQSRHESSKEENLVAATTMFQAYDIAIEEAKQWAEDAGVYKINSTDYLDTEDLKHGLDGRRNCWSFLFDSLQKGVQYHVYVVNGRVYSKEETKSPVYTSFDIEDILINSTDACKIAVKNGLLGGEEWAFGYHYILQYSYIRQEDEKLQLTLTVRGMHANGNEASMVFDPYTGEQLLMLEKSGYDVNGRSIWTDVSTTQKEEDKIKQEKEEELSLSREELQEKYEVYNSARKNLVDPEELTNAIIEGLVNDRFSPFSEIKVYEKEEWEKVMTERYGDAWKNW